MIAVWIFDMDDTLYDERQFVEGGFRAVARLLAAEGGGSVRGLYRDMLDVLACDGRGRVFDTVLKRRGIRGRTAVRRCLTTYRSHRPRLTLCPEARCLLRRWRDKPLYVVTDGNARVQEAKARALGLPALCRKVYCTHRYGRAREFAKPSPYCFELIRRREQCDWQAMAYVGDNPHKDFVGLNPFGMATVRVLTGAYRHVTVTPAYEARHVIRNLAELPNVAEGRQE